MEIRTLVVVVVTAWSMLLLLRRLLIILLRSGRSGGHDASKVLRPLLVERAIFDRVRVVAVSLADRASVGSENRASGAALCIFQRMAGVDTLPFAIVATEHADSETRLLLLLLRSARGRVGLLGGQQGSAVVGTRHDGGIRIAHRSVQLPVGHSLVAFSLVGSADNFLPHLPAESHTGGRFDTNVASPAHNGVVVMAVAVGQVVAIDIDVPGFHSGQEIASAHDTVIVRVLQRWRLDAGRIATITLPADTAATLNECQFLTSLEKGRITSSILNYTADLASKT